MVLPVLTFSEGFGPLTNLAGKVVAVHEKAEQIKYAKETKTPICPYIMRVLLLQSKALCYKKESLLLFSEPSFSTIAKINLICYYNFFYCFEKKLPVR